MAFLLQAFDWLNPNPNAPPVPADSVVAQRAAGNVAQPPASQDSQNVRNFVSQAGFTTGKGGSSTAATTQQQQGRRLLAEVQRVFQPPGIASRLLHLPSNSIFCQ